MPQTIRRGLPTVASILVGLVVWEIVGRLADADWLPPASDVFARVGLLWQDGLLQPAVGASLRTLLIGYAISVVLGLALGTWMGMSERAVWAFGPYVDAGLLTPVVIVVPIFLVILGISEATLIGIVVLFATFVIASTTRIAIESTDAALRQMAISLCATRRQILTQVTLRDAAPMIFSGLRLGMSRAVKGMIVGEVVVTIGGLGQLETAFATRFDATGSWAVTGVVLLIALIASLLVQAVDGLVNAWPR
ncbi:MAG TPA: ABC transporter permease subunit [Candidatus Limnocylindrales bacterium]|nr:ABC transporter permease subunit [Candidatus Limnocylindrales bacterium]